MQLGRVGSEQAEQMPEKEKAGGQREKKLIGHLGGQSRRGIHGGLINQTPENSPDEPEGISSARRVYFAGNQISIKLSGKFRPSRSASRVLKNILILTAGFGEGT